MTVVKSCLTVCLLALFCWGACGSDDGDEADLLGIGASCTAKDQCAEEQSCLTTFKGGYCGAVDCESNDDCVGASACVVHTDGKNYCFRTCTDKVECNANRGADEEANCSSSVEFASGKKEGKACIPPSG